METEAGVARGVAAIYVASITTLGLNTLFLVLLTNRVLVPEVGLFSLLNVIVVATATLSCLALPVGGTGALATPPAVARFLSEYIRRGDGSARKLYLTSVLACAGISLLLAFIISLPPVAGLIAGSLAVSAVVFATLDSIVYSFGQLGAYSMLGSGMTIGAGKLIIVSSLLRYGLGALLLLTGFGVPGVFMGFAAGDLVLAVSANFASYRTVRTSGTGKWNARPAASYMVSVLVAAVIGLGVSQTDKLLAFFQQGLGNLGIYNIATVGAAVASFAPGAATNVLVPALSSFGNDVARKRETLRTYTRYISVVASPMGFGLAAVSPFLLRVFGDAYVSAAPLMSIMSIAISMTAISSVYSSGLLVDNKAHLFSLGNIIGLAGLLGVALATVPTLGLLGIAIGRAVMMFATLLFFALFARWSGELVLDAPVYLKSLTSAAVMAVLVYGVLDLAASFITVRGAIVAASILMIPVGFAFYVIVMKLLRGFSQADVDFLEKIMPGWLSWLGELARKLL
jgi:O-antigen/teichoic acid export membrane protein